MNRDPFSYAAAIMMAGALESAVGMRFSDGRSSRLRRLNRYQPDRPKTGDRERARYARQQAAITAKSEQVAA